MSSLSIQNCELTCQFSLCRYSMASNILIKQYLIHILKRIQSSNTSDLVDQGEVVCRKIKRYMELNTKNSVPKQMQSTVRAYVCFIQCLFVMIQLRTNCTFAR